MLIQIYRDRGDVRIRISVRARVNPVQITARYTPQDTYLQEAQLLLRDRATFMSFENVVILSTE